MALVRNFEKRSSLSYGEEPNNCALAHCRCKNAAENFDRHMTQTLCKNYSRQDFVQDSRAFESVGISSCMCGVSDFNVGQIQSQGERLIHLQNFRGPITVVQLKTLNSLMCFSLVQNC